VTLPAHSEPRPLNQFRNHFPQMVELLRRGISPLQGRYLNTGQHKHKLNAYTHQTSKSWEGFEPTIPASKQAKTIHALDRSATVTGMFVEWVLVSPRSHRTSWWCEWRPNVVLGRSWTYISVQRPAVLTVGFRGFSHLFRQIPGKCLTLRSGRSLSRTL
jgi:hypothetical protein